MSSELTIERNLRFWIVWSLSSFATTSVAGPLSPFLGFNLMVYVFGVDYLGESLSSIVAFISVGLTGTVMGFIGLTLIRRSYGRKGRTWEAAVVAAFVLASFISMGTYLVITSGAFLGFIALCFGGFLLWVLATAILLSIPFWYRSRAPSIRDNPRVQAQESGMK